MSLQEDFDDYYFDRRRHKFKRPLLLLLVIGITLFVLGAAGSVAAFAVRAQAAAAASREAEFQARQAAAAKQAATAPRRLYSRDEFEKAVRGQHGQAVLATMGRPDETTAGPNGKDGPTQRWVYRQRVANAATGNAYKSVAVLIDRDENVSGIEYAE
jgi:hypothetical protein